MADVIDVFVIENQRDQTRKGVYRHEETEETALWWHGAYVANEGPMRMGGIMTIVKTNRIAVERYRQLGILGC